MAPGAALTRLLDALAPDQRAAVTVDPGPVLCVAPAGSGKTTTLVARVTWRLARGAAPGTVCALTFNRRAAAALRGRLEPLLADCGLAGDSVRVRTFHALAREILLEAGRPVGPVLDRRAVLGDASGGRLGSLALRRLDDRLARLKLEPGPGPPSPVLGAYQAALARAGGLDHDDLVVGALELLAGDPEIRTMWQRRCGVLLVDEVQDVDGAQWRLARILAAAHDLFAVGDDDQTIYAWRLADARRMVDLAAALPGLRRIDLRTNYRCPTAVVERAAVLVGHNRERLRKRIEARPGATGRLVLVADPGDDVARARTLLCAWADALRAGRGRAAPIHAILARTRAELAPFAAIALELGLPYWAEDDGLSFDRSDAASMPGWVFGEARDGTLPSRRQFDRALAERCQQRTALRRRGAPLLLATVHATKGLEFDVVACVGLDEGRFPGERGLLEAADPGRALEEERRLAYVAWTRAREALYLVHDPGAPSRFLREAFSPAELRAAATRGRLVVTPSGAA